MNKKRISKLTATMIALGITNSIITSNITYAASSGSPIKVESKNQELKELQSQIIRVLPDKIYDMEVGSSIILDTDENHELSITCTDASEDLTRAAWKKSYKTYTISDTIGGKKTQIVTIDLDCRWYQNGIDGYIDNFHGSIIKNYSPCTCYWDSYKSEKPYNHIKFLNLTLLGSSYSIMFSADYNPIAETLSFHMGN